MKFEKVTIKQIADDYAVMTGLHKHGRSKMPRTFEFLQPAEGPDGRLITGLDEDAIAVKRIADKEKREETIQRVKELRETLEQALGGISLKPDSKFWDNFGVHLQSDSDLILSNVNAKQQVMYHMLIANGYVAPDKDSASLPQYRLAKYYCHVTEREAEEQATDRLVIDRAKSKLVDLFDNPERMVLIGQYLEGDKYKSGMSPKTLYNMLATYIDNKREPDNIKRFVKAVESDVEDLQFKITVDRAIKKKIIRHKDGYFQRGQVTLGKNAAEVLKNLQTPEFATEFMSIKEEVEEA